MERIIMDSFIKQNKRIYGEDKDHVFNQRILAVNQMYGWLYNQGILEKVAFAYQDCPKEVVFAIDAKDLEPYRRNMEESRVPDAALAVQHLLDEPYTPCVYSGAIQMGWLMDSYRDVDGIVGRSWECDLVKFLNEKAVNEIAGVRENEGVKAAVQKTFSYYDWPDMSKERKPDTVQERDEEPVWICVYRDVLGLAEKTDNLTEICVPCDWLLEVLKEEGIDTDAWFDEYTADDTEQIARRALAEGVILGCADETGKLEQGMQGKEGVYEKKALSAAIRDAKQRSGNENTVLDELQKRKER